MLKLPCSKTCPKRKVGCHSTCPEYIEFRKSRDEINARRRAFNKIESDYQEVRRKHKER